MKLISFAIPCYNSAEYMGKCIDSLLKAGEEAEILIVNDGSTKDNTKEIADEYERKYPTIIKAIHKENGGHGDAVCCGLKNATGEYFKVIDSDDWVDESALSRLMDALRKFSGKEDAPDLFVVNYVYEHVYNDTRRAINYKKQFPEEKIFTFEESKPFETGKFLAMHSLIHKTELLRSINFELPKHTFYVDNLVIYQPLPHIKTIYYLNVDFYRYFIGRPDQSVQESVIMKRIDQHIRVTDIMIDSYNINEFYKVRPRLYRYMQTHLLIMMVINSIYLIKMGGKENLEKKNMLWQKLKEKDEVTYKRLKRRFTGITSSKNKFTMWFCKVVYYFARKKFKFN